jgi:hypothetical protein
VKQALVLRRSLRREGSVLARSQADWGQCVLGNGGALDHLRALEYGRPVRVLRGAQHGTYSAFWQAAATVASSLEVDLDEVRLTLRDRSRELDQRLATATLGGANSGPSGIDGSAEQKGQVKPRAFGGRIREAEPLLLNAPLLIFGLNFDRAGNPAPVAAIHGVKSRGGALAFGADYASLAALQAASVSAGTYATCKASGLVRLGSGTATALGTVTVDFTVESTAAARRPGAMLQSALLDVPGIAIGDLVAGDFAALDAAAPYELGGFYARATETTRDLIDAIAGSVLAWVATDRLGRYRCGRITAPASEPPVCTLARSDGPSDRLAAGEFPAIDFAPVPLAEAAQPFTRVRVGYQRIWTVMEANQLLQAVVETAPAQAAYFAQEYRFTAYADAAVSWGAERAFDLPSLLEHESDALVVRAELLAAFGVPRFSYRLRFPLSQDFAELAELGRVVTLRWPRFDLSGGRRARIVGQEISLGEGGAFIALTVQG